MIYGFSMWEFFKIGGFFMWPLLVFSIIGLTFILERSFCFLKVQLTVNKFINQGFIELKNGNIEQAIQCFKKSNKNYIGDVLTSGLTMLDQDISRIEKTIASEITIKVNTLEKGMNVFVVLSNLAPLTGFLGTVSGMIGAFKSIASSEEVSTQLVASGIFEALITTVAGLVIAIIVVSAYNIFMHKIDSFVSDSERLANEMTEILITKRIK